MSPCFISFLFNFLILNRIMVDNEKEEKYLCMQVVRCDSWGKNSEGKGSQGATEKSFECGMYASRNLTRDVVSLNTKEDTVERNLLAVKFVKNVFLQELY